MADAPADRSRPTIAGFFWVGVRGFGGVLPWARRTIVEERKWLTAAEFTEVLGECQFPPGGNIIDVWIAVRSRFGARRASLVTATAKACRSPM
jgi:chromate transporter